MDPGKACPKYKNQRSAYSRLIFLTFAGLRRVGIPKTIIMKIGGWRMRSVFERYAIVSRTEIADAMRKLRQSEEATQTQQSHEMVTAAVPLTQTAQ